MHERVRVDLRDEIDATANIDRAIPQASWWGRRRAAYWRRTAAANAAEAAAATAGSSQCMTGV